MVSKILKESRTPEVGPFYVIDGQVIAATDPVKEIVPVGGFRDSNNTHYSFWKLLRRIYAEYKDYDYDYFPRGRVVYNSTDGKYYLYLDKCINNEESIDAILDELSIPRSKVVVGQDEHYQCHSCNEDYVEISENFE